MDQVTTPELTISLVSTKEAIEKLPPSRSRSLALTYLEIAFMWVVLADNDCNSPFDAGKEAP